MKDIWKYVILGIAVAIGGMFFSELIGFIFNGMDYGSATVLGMGMYLCVVVVTCTGIIISKIEKNSHDGDSDDK